MYNIFGLFYHYLLHFSEYLLLPEKKESIRVSTKEIEKVQEEQKLLTDKEKELKELDLLTKSEEVDKDTNK